MNTKKLWAPLFAGALMIGLGSAAHAEPMYLDLCANLCPPATLSGGVDGWADQDGDEGSGANSTTEVFNQFSVHAETLTTQFDTDGSGGLNDGDRFSDFGHLDIKGLIPGGGGDNEGLNSLNGYQLTAAWSGLTGTASSLVPGSTPGTFTSNIVYDSVGNTTFDFYLDDRSGGAATRTNFNYGPTVSAGDDNAASFTDGVKVLSVLIVGGFGTNTFNAAGQFLGGFSTLIGEVVFALPGFALFADGTDFNELISNLVKISVFIDQNTDNAFTVAGPCGDNNPATPCTPGATLFQVASDHDGSIDFVRIPEPASVLLFGLGFLALGGITLAGRRQQQA